MPALIEVPLDLPHVRALHTSLDGRDLTVTVESTLESATCPHCGEPHPRIALLRRADSFASFAGLWSENLGRVASQTVHLSAVSGQSDHHAATPLV